ncbi:unnamed protein product [Absidia cylindrospora]
MLQEQCLCQKIFASVNSKSTKRILTRDDPANEHDATILEDLEDCDGNAQMTKYISLYDWAVISYAGLLNDPRDARLFLKLTKNIKEIAVDHGDIIEVLDRYSVFHNPKIIKRFKSRIGCVKRSM